MRNGNDTTVSDKLGFFPVKFPFQRIAKAGSRICEFNRFYVLLPLLVGIGLLISVYLIAEEQRISSIDVVSELRSGRQRIQFLTELSYATDDAETSSFEYLLSHEEKYLGLYLSSLMDILSINKKLNHAYLQYPDQNPRLEKVNELVKKKLDQIAYSIKNEQGRSQAKQSGLNDFFTGDRKKVSDELRVLLEDIKAGEDIRLEGQVAHWKELQKTGRISIGLAALLYAVFLVISAILVTRDMQKRTRANIGLGAEVDERTEELEKLATHLQKFAEEERSKLARELHDELGGLLVFIKMDLAHVAQHINIHDEKIALRWRRIQESLAEGVDLKRRIIEQLRPTLLDNMGLMVALRWYAEQTCEAGGIKLSLDLPDEEPVLTDAVGIGVYRVCQETLINTIKHAKAKNVKLIVRIEDEKLIMTIEDDGVGIGNSTAALDSHGLVGMRHRMRALRGYFEVSPVKPHGTRVVVKTPLRKAA